MASFTKGPWTVHRRPVTVCIKDSRGWFIVENLRQLPEQGNKHCASIDPAVRRELGMEEQSRG